MRLFVAAEVPSELCERLVELQQQYELIGDVRGGGLLIGVELVRDRDTLEPAGNEAKSIVNAMRDRGVLIGVEGPRNNVLKIRPPMVFTRENADQLIDTLNAVI